MKGLFLLILVLLVNCGSNLDYKYCNLLVYNRLTPISISNVRNFSVSDDVEVVFKARSENGDTVSGKIMNGIIVKQNN